MWQFDEGEFGERDLVQGVLGPDQGAGPHSRAIFHTPQDFRYHPKQDESEHLHDVRTGLSPGEEASSFFPGCDDPVQRYRGYTQLSETIDPLELSDIVSAFQDQCAHSIWAQDGIVNKQMGDGLMAIFNFPIKAEDHTGRAIDAAFDIQRRCGRNLSQLAGRLALLAGELGIGVGIHSGAVEIGEFGKERSGFTAIGGGVNLAARLESSARAGEIILSPDAAARVPGKLDRAEQRLLDLKGISEPVTAYILRGE